jgi:hypothetical protein
MVIFNNWNEDWHNDNGNQGPEVIKNKIFHKQGQVTGILTKDLLNERIAEGEAFDPRYFRF